MSWNWEKRENKSGEQRTHENNDVAIIVLKVNSVDEEFLMSVITNSYVIRRNIREFIEIGSCAKSYGRKSGLEYVLEDR